MSNQSETITRKDVNQPEADKHAVNLYTGTDIIFFLRLMDGKSKGKK